MKDILKGYERDRVGEFNHYLLIIKVSILNKKWWPLRLLSPIFIYFYFVSLCVSVRCLRAKAL
jgi:hypothetical protein